MRQGLMRDLAVLSKELRTRMRGPRAVEVITVYLMLLAGVAAFALRMMQDRLQQGFNFTSAPAMGAEMFAILSLFQLFLVIFIVPGLTGAAIAGERDRQTLDLLLATQVSSLWIILGKILSSLSYVLLLLIAALPIFSLVFLFGGVSPRQLALAFAISVATALTLGTIGVFLSTLVRRGPTATVLAYAVTFLMLMGSVAASTFISITMNSTPGQRLAVTLPLVVNPMAALGSAMVSSFFLGAPLYLSTSSSPGTGMPLWQANLLADAVIVVVLLYLSTVMLRPGGRRWPRLPRLWSTRRGMEAAP